MFNIDRRVLIIIMIAIALMLLYVHYAMKPKNEINIIQIGLHSITDSTLYEKQPIIIEDRVVDVKDVVNTLFKYQYVYKSEFLLEPDSKIYTNTQKFMIVYNPSEQDDAYVTIASPNQSDTIPSIDMILPANNILILPYKWTIVCNRENEEATHSHSLQVILLNDLIHRFFHRDSN